MPQCLDDCREMFGYSKWIIQGLTDRQTQGNGQLIIEANISGDILTSRNHETKMQEMYFNSCEVVVLQEKCGPFHLAGCVNRNLEIYITQAVTGHSEHERKPKVSWLCKTKMPAVADIQTGRQVDRCCQTEFAASMLGTRQDCFPSSASTTILEHLRSHLELLKVKLPLEIMDFALTNHMWNYANF